jgi:hypothetical protein
MSQTPLPLEKEKRNRDILSHTTQSNRGRAPPRNRVAYIGFLSFPAASQQHTRNDHACTNSAELETFVLSNVDATTVRWYHVRLSSKNSSHYLPKPDHQAAYTDCSPKRPYTPKRCSSCHQAGTPLATQYQPAMPSPRSQ